MHAINFSNARRNFDALFEKALSERVPITIVRPRGEGAIIIAESQWALMEAKVNRWSETGR